MKVFLLYRDPDFGTSADGPSNAADLISTFIIDLHTVLACGTGKKRRRG